MPSTRCTLALLLCLTGATAFAGDTSRKVVTPPEADRWSFLLSSPGWMPSLEGDTGIGQLVAPVDLDPGDLIERYDMVFSMRAEATRGRFGISADFLYTSLSDGIGFDGVVKKVDLQVDQMIGQLALRWRLIDSPRGFFEVTAGVRYVNLFQQVVTQANAERIDNASHRLVDRVSNRVAAGLENSDIRDLISEEIRTRLPGFDPERPSTLPNGPLAGRLADRLRERVQEIIEAKRDELAAAAEAVRQAAGAAREAAQARLDDLKDDLSKRIARTLEDRLATRAARTDDWWDPFVGINARYQFNDRFYVTTRGDVGGFGIGSDLSWQAEAAVGCKLTPRIFAEAGYRAMGIDYHKEGLTFDVIMHGAQVTLGIEL